MSLLLLLGRRSAAASAQVVGHLSVVPTAASPGLRTANGTVFAAAHFSSASGRTGRRHRPSPAPSARAREQPRFLCTPSALLLPSIAPAALGRRAFSTTQAVAVADAATAAANATSAVVNATSAAASASSAADTATTVASAAVASPPAPTVAAATAASPPPAADTELVLSFLPDKPEPLAELGTVLSEPTLQSLGLASWWPSGQIQWVLELMHVNLDLPWWGCIMAMTVAVRLLLFPVVVKSQKNAARLSNHMPGLQVLQDKMAQARERGDQYEAAMCAQDIKKYMDKHDVNPLKNFLPMLFQFPVFISFFVGLRQMANLPVDSMTSGGILWFTDLTLADPYYLLPVLSSLTIALQVKLGADGMNMQHLGPMGKFAMKFMPLVIIPMTMKFPAALGFYWVSSNCFSLCQASFLRIPAVRQRLGIPMMINHQKHKTSLTKEKGFMEAFRDTIDNYKVQGDIADRRAVDEQAFRDAGAGKPKRTFKFDPTKPLVAPKRRTL